MFPWRERVMAPPPKNNRAMCVSIPAFSAVVLHTRVFTVKPMCSTMLIVVCRTMHSSSFFLAPHIFRSPL